MSAVLERLRKRFDALQQEMDAVAEIAAEVDSVKQDCAVAMEAAYGDAARRCEAGQEAAIKQGADLERQRILLLISLVGESVKEGGSNAIALATLRRMVTGDDDSPPLS
jgi:hypothetical protein